MKHYLVVKKNNISGIFTTDKKFSKFLSKDRSFKFWYEIKKNGIWFGTAYYSVENLSTNALKKFIRYGKQLCKM